MQDRSQLVALVETTARELALGDDIEAIVAALSRFGFPHADIDRAVLFVPSAFARAFFEPAGITFSDQFLATRNPGEPETLSYLNEPIYLEACELARRCISESRAGLVQRVLDWSAEATGIRDARAQGLTPTTIGPVTHDI